VPYGLREKRPIIHWQIASPSSPVSRSDKLPVLRERLWSSELIDWILSTYESYEKAVPYKESYKKSVPNWWVLRKERSHQALTHLLRIAYQMKPSVKKGVPHIPQILQARILTFSHFPVPHSPIRIPQYMTHYPLSSPTSMHTRIPFNPHYPLPPSPFTSPFTYRYGTQWHNKVFPLSK